MKTSCRRQRVRVLLVTVVAALTSAFWPVAASAHGGGAKITVNHDGKGAVWVNVTFDDGHQDAGLVDATLTAKEASGASVAPAKMVQSSAPGTLVYMSTLTTGSWKVNVEFAPPIARMCEAAFDVGTSNNTKAVQCDAPTPLPASAAAVAASGGGDNMAWLLIGVAVVGGVVCAAIAVMFRRRPRAALATNARSRSATKRR